ncbi:MAG: cysteine hydrolase [Deltaproteobacteria bacterium]|nr:cysteine hydrolase [Deltaproteobacteria bacterium]
MGVQEDLEVAGRIAHVKPLGSLEEKLKPAHTALLVIDMQNDFCASGGLISKDGRDVSAAQELGKRLPAFISTARDAGVMVVFIRCVYTTERNFYLSDVWLEMAARKREGGYTRIPVCRDGAWEGDYYGEVRPHPGDVVVTKHRYNAFHNTDLDLILRSNGIRTVALTGVVTNVCVETTAREAFVRDYYVVAVDDGCAAYVQQDHIASLSNIDRFFGEVSTIKQISALWDGAADAQVAAE